MAYFTLFPVVPYTYTSNGNTFALTITNLTTHVLVVERLQQLVSSFYDYVIQDGERPDIVAARLYGSPDFTWLVLLLNNIMSLYDWPLTTTEFNNYIVDKYGSVVAAQQQLIYTTIDQFYVDSATFYLLPVASRGVIRTAYDDELTQNEAKRTIRVIPADFASQLTNELRTLLA